MAQRMDDGDEMTEKPFFPLPFYIEKGEMSY